MAQNIPESVVDAVCDGDLVAVSAWLKNGGNEFVDEALEGHPFILPSLKHLISQAIEHSANASAIVELLLQAGAHPRLEFLLAAIEKENVEAALLLVAHGVDVRGSQDGRTALHSVTEYASLGALARQDELVHALLEAGAPADARWGQDDRTPLMEAAWSGFTNPRVLRLLLKYGADLDAVDANGNTADYYAHVARGFPIYTPDYTRIARAPGVVEGALAFFRDYRAACGTWPYPWKRYVVEPRKQLLVLRKLVEKGRARPPRRRRAMAPTGLFGRDGLLPDVLFWKVLAYWRSERDV